MARIVRGWDSYRESGFLHPNKVATQTNPKPAPTSTHQSPVLAWFRTAAEETEAGVLVPVLLFTTGTHTDMGSNTNTYTQRDLNRIVRATKTYYKSGDDIPIFEANHEYSNADKIGRLAVDEGLTVEQITAENLPDPRLKDLIGEYGIYGYALLARPDAIERYHQTLIKPISIAFDPSGEFTRGNKWAIFEVSAVPWGAVRGAMLFGRFPCADYAPEEVADMPKPETKKHALTLDGAMAEKEGRHEEEEDYYHSLDRKLSEVMMLFNDVVSSIRYTTDEELQGRDRNTLLREAVADLSAKLEEELGVRRDPPPPVSVNSKEAPMPDPVQSELLPIIEAADNSAELADLKARLEAAESNNAQLLSRLEKAEQDAATLAYERQVADKVNRLKAWGAKLVQLGKVTPVAYKEWFPEDEQATETVQRFSRKADGDTSGEVALTEIEAALKYADKYAEPVRFGSVVGSQPVGSNPYRDRSPELESEAEAYAKEFRSVYPVKRPY